MRRLTSRSARRCCRLGRSQSCHLRGRCSPCLVRPQATAPLASGRKSRTSLRRLRARSRLASGLLQCRHHRPLGSSCRRAGTGAANSESPCTGTGRPWKMSRRHCRNVSSICNAWLQRFPTSQCRWCPLKNSPSCPWQKAQDSLLLTTLTWTHRSVRNFHAIHRSHRGFSFGRNRCQLRSQRQGPRREVIRELLMCGSLNNPRI